MKRGAYQGVAARNAGLLGQFDHALLTMLYRSTHCLCRSGASVQYLSHNSSLRSWPYLTLAHRGTKHLEPAHKTLSIKMAKNQGES